MSTRMSIPPTTTGQATALAMAMPGAEQKSHFENVDFRVRNKIFASFTYPDMMTLKLDPEHARMLIGTDSDTYALHQGVWGRRGWIRVTLSRIAADELADLIHESWSRVAPKRIQVSN
jgi:predicted DNA-binding protein (MmcQ/YjbR family)